MWIIVGRLQVVTISKGPMCHEFCIVFSSCDTPCAGLGHYVVYMHMQTRVTMRIARRRCQRYTNEAGTWLIKKTTTTKKKKKKKKKKEKEKKKEKKKKKETNEITTTFFPIMNSK